MQEFIETLPEKPGVYFFFSASDEIIYIGKSVNLKKRITDHFRKGTDRIFKKVIHKGNVRPPIPKFTWDYTQKHLDSFPSMIYNKERKKKKKIINTTKKVKFIITEGDVEAHTLEGCLISAFRPSINRSHWKYPFIEITLGEEVPRVLTSYQILLPESFIYGPFNVGSPIDIAIDGFLRVIPICNNENPIKLNSKAYPSCLKEKLQHCQAPCKNGTFSLQKYLDLVDVFIKELENKGTGVINKLKKLMTEETVKENFEGAAILRDRIQAIEALFNQKAMPTMLEKYYSEIEDIVNKDPKHMEIIDKILAKDNVLN
jgi:excinuclease ABC subunit C